MDELKKARLTIDEVDKKMAALFEERMVAIQKVAEYKKLNGLPITDSKREAEMIERNKGLVQDPLIQDYYVQYLQAMMNVSKKYQTRLNSGSKVAYCGVEGAYAYLAAKKIPGYSDLVAYSSFEKAYASVVDGYCDGAILPIENSYAGDVGSVLDLSFSGNLSISQVIELEICHALLVKPGTKIEDIKTVWSHPQALSQCDEYIRHHGLATIEYPNTAIASKALSESAANDVAVIASPENAELYGLEVLEYKINTSSNNTTRFALFTRSYNKPDASSKMGEHFVLVFTVLNEAGALAKALNIIGAHSFNMRNLRSRPMKSLMWNYYFFVELEGNVNSADGRDMLQELNTICDKVKLLGTYQMSKGE